MALEYVSFKLEGKLLGLMEHDMKDFHYPTKSDFLREAIREKHLKLEGERRKERMLVALEKLKGSSKTNTTDKDTRRVREEVGEELFKKLMETYAIKENLPQPTPQKPLLQSAQK